jgi:hypothetical protein
LVSVSALVLARAVAWWKGALLGAKATAEPAERKRTAVESFIVNGWWLWWSMYVVLREISSCGFDGR